jgi:hypothetical protein
VALPEALATPLPAGSPRPQQLLQQFLVWFHQPSLPRDPINNPLVDAPLPLRVAAALRVYASGVGQVLFPWTLSGDYSFAQEPVPKRLLFPGSVLGGLAFVGLPVLGVAAFVRSVLVERALRLETKPDAPPPVAAEASPGAASDAAVESPPSAASDAAVESPPSAASDAVAAAPPRKLGVLRLLAIGAVWLPVAYAPHANLVLLLPTVRAERFWYLPIIGSALCLPPLLLWLLEPARVRWGLRVVLAFFAVQAIAARKHALDYTDDLAFWRATREAAPESAKAHLNYSVMVGARGRLEERLAANRRAIEIAPNWPMAQIYYGDTLCRLRRTQEAWPYYERGFKLAPNDPNLIALALQCMWDQDAIESRKDALVSLAQRHPGSWLAFLANDIVYYGKKHGGVQKQYRPRSYDEGPKKG